MPGLIAALLLMTQPVEAPPPVEAAAWLEGCWAGEGFGSLVTECWMSAPSGTMTGMFQMLDETGEQQFSEIFVLSQYESGRELRLRHFNRDMTGWEAQDDWVSFPLIEQGEDFLRFEGLEYRLTEAGNLQVALAVGGEAGVRTEHLMFERVR